MLKTKKLIIALMLLLAVLLIPNMVKATDDEITIDRITTSTDGSISFVIKGLELDNTSNYEWNIEKIITTEKENWYQATAPDYENGEIRIDVNASNAKQLKVLKSVDNAYISIRKVGETKLILEDEKVDLTLPLLSTYKVTKSVWYGTAPKNPAYEVRTIYGMNKNNVAYCFDKITDADLVNNYIDNNHNLEGLNLATISEIPDLSDTRWKSVTKKSNTFDYSEIENTDLPTEDGLYYLWLKGNDSENGVKTIYGYTIIEIGEVKKIDKTDTDTDNDDENPIDTTRYISFPMMIINGKGTLNLKSGVYDGDYTIYYQFIEVPEEEYNKLEDLKEQYENEEITYEEFYTKYNETVTKYDESKWIKTEDGSFEQDLNKFTGTKKFALWVKLEMEDKTVYEAEVYTMNGSGSATTEEPDSTNKPGAEDTNKGDTNTKDPTIADKELPNTGKVILAWIIGVVAVFGIVAHIRYKKLYM